MGFISYAAILEHLLLETKNPKEDEIFKFISESQAVKDICGGPITSKGGSLTSVAIGRSAVVLMGTGSVLGQLLEWYKFAPINIVKGNQWDWHDTRGFSSKAIRIAILLIFWVVIAGIYSTLHNTN